MLVNKCDVCGIDKEYMEQFLVPMRGFKREECICEYKWRSVLEKGVFPFNVHLCPACQKKISDYIETIRTTINLD